jgi:RNA polymerase subunit RPABC4/transcription elongation factor Spt4
VQPVIAYNRTSDLQSPAAQPAAPTAGPGEVVCGSCGELTAADDLLCIACGSFLGDIGSDAPLAAAAEPEPEPEVQTGPQILTCSDCGSEVTPDELFCPSCGAVL